MAPQISPSATATSGSTPLSPFDSASLFAKSCFTYVQPLLRAGKRQPLTASQVPPLATRDTAERVTQIILQAWLRKAGRAMGCTQRY